MYLFNKLIYTNLILLLLSQCAYGQWPALANPNVAVTSQAATVDAARYWACRDGVGGSYVVWEDDRNDLGGNTGIFSQRMQSFGVVKFVANGIQIADTPGDDQKRPWVAEGANSTALYTWEDERNNGTTDDDIYAKSIDSVGATSWGGVNGILICNAIEDQERPQIVSDGSGGGIIVWRDRRDRGTTQRDIYAQRVNSAGTVQWAANGVVISNAVDDQTNFSVISDGLGGAIIVWEDDRSGSTTDIYGQRIDGSGIVQWTANGLAICNEATDDQTDLQIIGDGSGGVVVTWVDLRNNGATGSDIYAQSINSAGAVQWAANGIVICDAIDDQDKPVIESDGSGGGIIIWEDNRNSGATSSDVYSQKVNSAGVVQWAANGIVVCNNNKRQRRVHSSPANNGAVLVTWEDRRNNPDDIYIELIASDGTMSSGTVNGVQICDNVEDQGRPFIFDNGADEWIVVWEDNRNDPGGNNDIYAQGLNPSILSALSIELIYFNAIPNGDNVELVWETSSEINNEYFLIERSEDGLVWEEVIEAKGAGTNSSVMNYFEIDTSPFLGLSYYRITQYDYNGKSETFNIVPVEIISTNNGTMSVFPNPADIGERINVSFKDLGCDNDKEILVVLRDIIGNEVYSKVELVDCKEGLVAIDRTHHLASGTYLVIASSENLLYSQKLIIK